MPTAMASTSARTTARPASSRSSLPTARPTRGVVPYARKLKTTNVIEKIEVFTPRAPSGMRPNCPTNAVSTSETSGPAASPARAGTARSKMSRSYGLERIK